MNIAIIGCGIGGIHILKTIIDHPNFNENIKIHIFEKNDRNPGRGLAYEDDTKYKLLNVHEEYVTLELDNPDHIFSWLDQNKEYDFRIEGMLPRTNFGKYISDTYKVYIENPQVNIHTNEEVIDLIKNENTYKLVSDKNTYDEEFDVVFLSIGQSYYKDAYDLKNEENYIHNPYPLEEKLITRSQIEGEEQFLPIDKDTRIGVIGTGPTSIDIYRILEAHYKIELPLYFFTQSSGFMTVEIPLEYDGPLCQIDEDWIEANKDIEGFIDLGHLVEVIKADFSKHGYSLLEVYDKYKDTDIEKYKAALKDNDQELAFAQNYTMDLWNVASKLYNSLSGLDRLKVDKEYLQKVDFLITKTPTETMKKLINSYDEGMLKIIRDTNDVVKDGDKFIVKSDSNEDVEVDILINAQGFEKDLTKAIYNDKLLGNLYDHDFIEPDINNKYIRVTYPAYNLINKKYGFMENIYLGGMWAGATDILNNDIRSILRASELMANDFMDKLDK